MERDFKKAYEGKCKMRFVPEARAFLSVIADLRDKNPKAGRRKERTPREKRTEAKFQ